MSVGFAREFVQVTQESSYLTPKVTPVRGTDQIVIRLEEGNSFSMRPVPITQSVMYGGGYNVESDTISDKTQLKGTLKTTFCYSQASLLLGAALTKINSGQTAPWTTTEPANQLASVTIDHAVWQDDTGAYKRTRYLGCKVDAGSLSSSEDGQKFLLSLDFNGSTYQGNSYDASTDPNATVFPQPADNEYPTDYVLFSHANGGLSIDSAAFAEFLSLNCSWQYNHVLNFFANRFVQKQRTWGRKVKLDADVILRASPDLRGAFQTLASKTLSLTLTNGTHTIVLDWKTRARIEGLDDDLPLGTNYQRKLSLGSRYDTTNNVDFLFTYT